MRDIYLITKYPMTSVHSNFGHTRESCLEWGPLLAFSTIYKRSLTCTLFLMAATLCSTFLCLSETEELCKDFSRGPWKNILKFQHIKKIFLIWTIFKVFIELVTILLLLLLFNVLAYRLQGI